VVLGFGSVLGLGVLGQFWVWVFWVSFGFCFGIWVLLRLSDYDDYFYKKVALFACHAPQNTSS
jgi:hypothetical protein